MDYPAREGIGVYSFELAKRLGAAGHPTTLLTRGRGISAVEGSVDGVPIVRLPFLPIYPFHVHLHTFWTNRYLAPRRNTYDLVHAHSPLAAIPAPSWPLVTTLHSSVADDGNATKIDDVFSLLTRLQTPVSAALERRLLRRSMYVTVVNPLLADRAAEISGAPDRVRVVMNAVDTLQFAPAQGVASPSGATVLFVGRLAPGKGLDELLNSWPVIVAAHPKARLRIIGSGPSRRRAQQTVSDLGIDGSVELVGQIGRESRAKLAEAYRSAAVLVQPSHHEAISTTVLEGMASGLPVVATNVGGHSRVITDGVNGFLVPPRDAQALAIAVIRLLGDPKTASAIGGRARARVQESFGWDSLVERYIECYKEAIGACSCESG